MANRIFSGLKLMASALGLLDMSVVFARAQEFPHALPEGERPEDVRLAGLRDLDSFHPFHAVDSKTAWRERAAALRRQVLVATGLWPMPTRRTIRPVIHRLVERDDYTVEKV